MPGFLLQASASLVLLGAGWFAGSLYPAPEPWTTFVKGHATPVLARVDLSREGLESLRATLTREELQRLTRNAAILAASAGEVIPVERSGPAVLEEHAEAAEALSLAATAPGASAFEPSLRLCPGMTVSNAPPRRALQAPRVLSVPLE